MVMKAPLDKQVRVQTRVGVRSNHAPNPALYEALEVYPESLWEAVSIVASDVQIYDVFSVLCTDDAVLLLEHQITSSDAAVAFMEQHGLRHLLIDRRDMMVEAQNNRLSAWSFMGAQHKFGINEMTCDEKVLLGAVRLDVSDSLPRWADEGEECSYAHHVARGNINYDDVMALGITLLSTRKPAARVICEYLKDIHAGRVDYDVQVLRHVLIELPLYMQEILSDCMLMVHQYEAEVVLQVEHLSAGLAVERAVRERPASKRADAILYSQRGLPSFYNLNAEQMVYLYDSGVPAEVAADMLEQGMDLERIASVHASGINTVVSSGWL